MIIGWLHLIKHTSFETCKIAMAKLMLVSKNISSLVNIGGSYLVFFSTILDR